MPRVTELTINGKRHSLDVDGQTTLLIVLRDYLDLTGTKYSCGEGQCGACTVLIDGTPQHSCQTAVGTVASKQITTVEGLAENGRLHPLQQAFLDKAALQCGFCTPGMLMAAAGLLHQNPNPNEDTIKKFLEGNICRCGVYPRIVEAVQHAADLMRNQHA